MNFANEWEIQEWRARTRGRGDNLESAVLILQAIAADANAHSDGWAYWPKPCRAAAKLIALIQSHTGNVGGPDYHKLTPVHAADLRKALIPVRAFYTKQHALTPAWPESFRLSVRPV
jgi:hypothetical protein